MSKLTEWLKDIGVPVEFLAYGQKLIDSWKGEAAKMLPAPAELVTSIRGQDLFKRTYRVLTVDQKKGVDMTLLPIATAALVKVKKVLGLP
jgi:hypothetical protein